MENKWATHGAIIRSKHFFFSAGQRRELFKLDDKAYCNHKMFVLIQEYHAFAQISNDSKIQLLIYRFS